jgi:adenosylcobinamide kinase / adenosylcobinamide-phosphate guanylyltransferase
VALIFVTGGARSGKSSFAFARAAQLGGDAVSFIATAEALDHEMHTRISQHRLERNPAWQTLEQPSEIDLELCQHDVIVLDCVSLWVSNQLLRGDTEAQMLERTEALIAKLESKTLIVVTNEVGFGIVPDNALARAYRDALGRVNQYLARAASEAHLLVSGIPVVLKERLKSKV